MFLVALLEIFISYKKLMVISFKIFMESELSNNYKKNKEIICNLFMQTEKYLHYTIASRTAPYTANRILK